MTDKVTPLRPRSPGSIGLASCPQSTSFIAADDTAAIRQSATGISDIENSKSRSAAELSATTCAEWLGSKLNRYSEKEVAAYADCPPATAAALRAGKHAPTMATLSRLFKALPRLFVDYKREVLGFHVEDDPAFEAAMLEATAAHRKSLHEAIARVAAERIAADADALLRKE